MPERTSIVICKRSLYPIKHVGKGGAFLRRTTEWGVLHKPPFFGLAKFLGKSRVFTKPKPPPFWGGRVCLAHLTLPLYSIFDHLWATSDLAPRYEALGIPETAGVR